MLVQFCQNLHCKYHRWLHVFLHESKKHVAWSDPFDQNYYCKYHMWQVAFLHELMKHVTSRKIFIIKINPANITLKEITNFQGFLIQKQVHPIFVLLECCYFHFQKMTWWDLILHHQSLECFIFSALLNFLIDCRDKMFSTFSQSEVLSTKEHFLNMW